MAVLVLVVVMTCCVVVALALGIVGRRRLGPGPLVGEAVMLVAVVDAHLPGLGVLPVSAWALLLGACAMVTALLDRLAAGARRPGGDHLHALGMVLGAVFLVLGGAHGAGGAPGHVHGGAVVVPLVAAVVLHVGAVAWTVVVRRPSRVEATRRVAALAGVLVMGVMAVAH